MTPAAHTLEKNMRSLSDNNPRVSIIVAVTGDRGLDSVFGMLDSFLPQEGGIDFEFLVVDEADEERNEVYRKRFPWVKLIRTEKLKPVPYLRNIALSHARGEIIAFADDHVFFSHDYLISLVGAFSKGYKVVGGPLANANPETLASWVQIFCEYHKWLPGIKEGEVEDLPGSNFSYHRDLLNRLGPFAEGEFGIESNLHNRAKKDGNKLYFCNGHKLSHINEENIRVFWRRRFEYGRLFAARRHFSPAKRVAYVILSPLIAVTEYFRIFGHARHDRTFLRKFVQCTPLLFITLFIWMAGESAGYLGAAGSSVR